MWGDNAKRYLQQHGMNDFGNIAYTPAAQVSPTQLGTPMPANYNWETGLSAGTGPGGTATAAAQQTQQDVSAFNNRGNRNGTGGPGGPGQGNNTGNNQTQTPQAPISPDQFNSTSISGSPEWYGQMSNYGVQQALGSPIGFWGQYGSHTQGWDPAGNNTAFMASRYDPLMLGAALNPQGTGHIMGDEDYLAQMTALGNQLGGASSQAKFINPTQAISGVLHAIATNDDNALANANPYLANLIQQTRGNPAQQVDTILQYFQSILPSMMPKEMADALVQQMQAVGSRWAMGLGDVMPGQQFDAANFAQVLLQTFGSALGI